MQEHDAHDTVLDQGYEQGCMLLHITHKMLYLSLFPDSSYTVAVVD